MEPSKTRYSILKGASNESKIDQNKLARKVRFSSNFVKGFTTSEDGNHTKWESTYEEELEKSTPSHLSNIEATQQMMNTLFTADTSEESSSYLETTSSNSSMVKIKGLPTFLESAKSVMANNKQSLLTSNSKKLSDTFSSPDTTEILNLSSFKNNSIGISSSDDNDNASDTGTPQTKEVPFKPQLVEALAKSSLIHTEIQSHSSNLNQTRFNELSVDHSVSMLDNQSDSQNKRVSRLGEITKIFDVDDDDYGIEETQKMACQIVNKTTIFDQGCMEETKVLSTSIYQNKENVPFECTKLFLGNEDAVMEESLVLSPTIHCHISAATENNTLDKSLTANIPEILCEEIRNTMNMENIRPKSSNFMHSFKNTMQGNATCSSKNENRMKLTKTEDQMANKSIDQKTQYSSNVISQREKEAIQDPNTSRTSCNKSIYTRTEIFDQCMEVEETECLTSNIIQNITKTNENTTNILDQGVHLEKIKSANHNMTPRYKGGIEQKDEKTHNMSLNKTNFTRICDGDADMEETNCLTDNIIQKDFELKRNTTLNATFNKSILTRTKIFDDGVDMEVKFSSQNPIQVNSTRNVTNTTKIFHQDKEMEGKECLPSNLNHNCKIAIDEKKNKTLNASINKNTFMKTKVFDQDADMDETNCLTSNINNYGMEIDEKKNRTSKASVNKSTCMKSRIFDHDAEMEETKCVADNVIHKNKEAREKQNNKTPSASIKKSILKRPKIFDQYADMEETKCVADNISDKSKVVLQQKNNKTPNATINKSIFARTKIFDQGADMEETNLFANNIIQHEKPLNQAHETINSASNTKIFDEDADMSETKSFQRNKTDNGEIPLKNITTTSMVIGQDMHMEETKCATDDVNHKGKVVLNQRNKKTPDASVRKSIFQRTRIFDEDMNIEETKSLTMNIVEGATTTNEANQTKIITNKTKVFENDNDEAIDANKENSHKSITKNTTKTDPDVDMEKTNYTFHYATQATKSKETSSKLASWNKTANCENIPVSTKINQHHNDTLTEQVKCRSSRKALNEIPQTIKVVKQPYEHKDDTDIIEMEDDIDITSCTKPTLSCNRQIFKDDTSNKENHLRSFTQTIKNANHVEKRLVFTEDADKSMPSCSYIHMGKNHGIDETNISGVDKLLDSDDQIINIADTIDEPSIVYVSDSEEIEKVKILQNLTIVTPTVANLSASSSIGIIDNESLEWSHSLDIPENSDYRGINDLQKKYLDDPTLNKIKCPDNTDWSVYDLNISNLKLNIGQPECILTALRNKRELKAAIKKNLEERYKILETKASVVVGNLSETQAELEVTHRNFMEVKSLPKEVLEKTLTEQIKFKAINHFNEYKIIELTATSLELAINIPKCELIIKFEEDTGLVKRLERRDCFLEETEPSDYITNFTVQILSATLIRPALGLNFSVLSVQDYVVMHFSSLSDVLDNICYMWMTYASIFTSDFRQSYRYLSRHSFVEVQFDLSGYTPKKFRYEVIVHYGRAKRRQIREIIANVTRDSQFLQNACNLCDEYLSSLET